MRHLHLSLFALIMFISPQLHAQPIDEQLATAIQDYQFQDFDEAEAKLRSILNQAPENLSAHYYLGVILTQKGAFIEAIEHLEHVANASVTAEGIDEALVQAYQGANQFEKALPVNKKLYSKSPENDAYAFQYAVNLQKTGATGQAKEIYDHLISKGGNYTEAARYQMGTMLYEEKSYVEAVKAFEAIDPESPYGDAGKAYVKALKPLTRPVNAYLSVEYFYNDNVNSGSRIGTVTAGKIGSQGFTTIGVLNTRQFEISKQFRWKLGYLYYGILHTQNNTAKQYDFIGHFINPEISYHPNSGMDFRLKGDFQFFNYNHQTLSDNYGATFTATRYLESGQGSANLHAAYLKKNYTGNYTSGGTTQSLTYLDANTWSFGVGGTYSGQDWPASLTLDYTFNDENTLNNTVKAQESRYSEHAVRADATLPFTGQLSRYALLANASYSEKNYSSLPGSVLARQVYTDVAAGQKIDSRTTILGIKAQALLWDEYGLTASVGYEQTKSSSTTTSLTYKSKKYFGQLAAAY
ncbi:MAG: hypothetical protein RQ867_03725 [Mariprofundaceae bacterium]|nr:hypothetical protein [Mariprofundaceae bacterium]